jgi:hypothetical protein
MALTGPLYGGLSVGLAADLPVGASTVSTPPASPPPRRASVLIRRQRTLRLDRPITLHGRLHRFQGILALSGAGVAIGRLGIRYRLPVDVRLVAGVAPRQILISGGVLRSFP